MSKKKLNLDKLEPAKKLKKPEVKIDTERAVQSIHSKKQDTEKIKRISIDIPFYVYVDVRRKTIEEEITLKDYFLELAQKDLTSE